MIEAMDQEIGRVLVELGLATRAPDGRLDYHPDATNTMVVIVGDNGSYLQTVRLPFDPQRGKGTPYQTGVWVPLIVAGPLVDPANVGSEVRPYGQRRGGCVRLVRGDRRRGCAPGGPPVACSGCAPAAALSDHPGAGEHPDKQLHPDRHQPPSPGGPIPPCVLQPSTLNVCTQIFPFQALCETEGGVWYGPGGAAGPNGLQTCCQVQTQVDPSVTLLAHDAWAIRDDAV